MTTIAASSMFSCTPVTASADGVAAPAAAAATTSRVTVTYVLSDGQGGTATGTVTLDVVAPAAGAATPSALAVTGVQLNMLLAAIVALVGAGAGLTVVARRRLQV